MDSDDDRRPVIRPYHWLLFWLALGVSALAAAALALVNMAGIGLATGDANRPLMMMAPWLDLAGSLIVTITIAILAARRGISPLVGIAIGTMVFLISLQF